MIEPQSYYTDEIAWDATQKAHLQQDDKTRQSTCEKMSILVLRVNDNTDVFSVAVTVTSDVIYTRLSTVTNL